MLRNTAICACIIVATFIVWCYLSAYFAPDAGDSFRVLYGFTRHDLHRVAPFLAAIVLVAFGRCGIFTGHRSSWWALACIGLLAATYFFTEGGFEPMNWSTRSGAFTLLKSLLIAGVGLIIFKRTRAEKRS